MLKNVMQYSQTQLLRVPALKWGVDHEDRAQQYVELSQEQHESFECHPVGLTVNPEHLYLGASPDVAIVCVPVVVLGYSK